MSGEQAALIRAHVGKLLSAIRPEAVALVDSFDYTDRELGSILGRYDGNVYDNLFEWAKRSPLNETDVSLIRCVFISFNLVFQSIILKT